MKPRKAIQSAEFALVLACVRWPLDPLQGELIHELAQQPLHWPHLLRIVEHHQVTPLVARNLEPCAGSVPPEIMARLRAEAAANARTCFRNASELAAIAQLFRAHELEFRIFKGAPLAIAAFGDVTLRAAGDIDLLVRVDDLPAADSLLRGLGYLRLETEAQTTPRRMRSYLAHQKDFSYQQPETGSMIDLHWRLFRNPRYPTNGGLEEVGMAWVRMGPEQLPTFSAQCLFLYLCVHGALDGWLRLKWLADVGALLRAASDEDLDSLAEAARARSVATEFGAAVHLCREYLGFDRLPARCLPADSPKVARILRFAGEQMSAHNYCPDRLRVRSTAWLANELSLSGSFRSRTEIIERSLFRPRVWQKISLPDTLFPLYAVLSPFEWLAFRVQRLKSSSRDGAEVSAAVQGPVGSGSPAGGGATGEILRRGSPDLSREDARGTSLRASPNTSLRASPNTSLRSGRLLSAFFALDPGDLALLLEAGALLLFFRGALQLIPVERLTRWMGRTQDAASAAMPHSLNERNLPAIRRIEWAIGALARHAPLAFVCFPQAFAAYFMLRRRRIQSRMFYGVARQEQELKTHAWIKVGERTVVGGEAETEFTVLAVFP